MPDEQKSPDTTNPVNNDTATPSPADTVSETAAVELAAIESQSETTDPTTSPRPIVSPPASAFASPEPKSKKRRGVLIILAAILVLAIAAGGSWAAYALWYQNPEKVLLDSFTNAYKAKSGTITGSANLEAEDGAINLTFNSAQDKNNGSSVSAKLTVKSKEGTTFTLEGDTLYDKNMTTYFRVKNIKEAYEKAVDAYVQSQLDAYAEEGQPMTPAQQQLMKQEIKKSYDGLVGGIIAKVDNRWIKVSVDDLKDINPEAAKEYECTQSVMKKAMNNHKVADQIVEVYKKNKFLVIKENLGVKEGSQGYAVDIDKEKMKKFEEESKKTDIYQEFDGCTKSDANNSSSSSTDKVDQPSTSQTTQRVEIWVDQWSHQLTSVKANTTTTEAKKTTKFDMNAVTKFNNPVTITVPADTMSLKELRAELQNIFSTFGGTEEQSNSDTAGTV